MIHRSFSIPLQSPEDTDWERPDLTIDEEKSLRETLLEHYRATRDDYRYWSHKSHKHFGYWRAGLNPFNREQQLDEMSKQVFARLQINQDARSKVLDLGCGAGASLRVIAGANPRVSGIGVTLVPEEVEDANKSIRKSNLQNRLEVRLGDYLRVDSANKTFDGAYCIESFCHTPEHQVKQFAKTCFDLLKPGARLVVADCFDMSSETRMNWIARHATCNMKRAWGVPRLPSITKLQQELEGAGFTDITSENISWNIAPTVLSVPGAIIAHTLKNIVCGKKLSRHSITHLYACLSCLLIGATQRRFQYRVLRAVKL